MTKTTGTRLLLTACAALMLSGVGASAQGIQLDLNNGRIGVTPPREERLYERDDERRRGPRIIEEEQSGISCGEGRRIVSQQGYRNVRPVSCGGRNYTYSARERGEPVEVTISARSGRIVSVQPL